MFSFFVRFLKDEDSVSNIRPEDVELITPIYYGTKHNDELTRVTRANLEKAIGLQELFPDAVIAMSSCLYLFKGSKTRRDFFFGTSPVNSIDEAEQLRSALSGDRPRGILVVTGELHSRSARLIYGRVFPGTKIFVVCNSYKIEVEPDHPVKDQRVMWRWAISNILRELAIRLLPWEVARKIRHKSDR